MSVAPTVTDPDANDTHSLEVDWGDGTIEPYTGQSHAYADGGTYMVTVEATDSAGAVGSDTLMLTVNDVADGGRIINITDGGNGHSYDPSLSADCSTVAFVSQASNLVDGQTDANGTTDDIFVYDRDTGTISAPSSTSPKAGTGQLPAEPLYGRLDGGVSELRHQPRRR